jgi:predicted enzyme related to lactoylglutathione lyase
MLPVVNFELPADDTKRAKKFYEEVFGWNVIAAYDTFHFALTTTSDANKISKKPGEINGAIQKRDETIDTSRIIIKVPNLDEATTRVLEEGGNILVPKRKNPAMYWSVILDTEGNQINLIERIS